MRLVASIGNDDWIMPRSIHSLSVLLLLVFLLAPSDTQGADALLVGFGEMDITPDPGKNTVYLAGFGKNRKATKVHDPIMVRALVLEHDSKKIAIVSADL